jgi:hypothetical protein
LSLPSVLEVFDKDNKLLAEGFINIGWIPPDSYFVKDNEDLKKGYVNILGLALEPHFCRMINEAMTEIRENENCKEYYHEPNWLVDLDHITAYGITISRERVKHILLMH